MIEDKQPLMILLAGPNGAGKTTFRQKFLETNPIFSDLKSLNWDDETLSLKTQHPNMSEKTARIDAGKKIISLQRGYIQQKHGFIYETVAADKRHFRLISSAKNAGFKIISIFIGLASPDLSKMRVKHRVANGGHNVDSVDIETRYPKIMENFPQLVFDSDTCFVIDNSGKNFRLILLKSNNLSITFSNFPNYLPHDQFDMTKEKQQNGSMLLTTDAYMNKSNDEKQELIRYLLESFRDKSV